MPAAVASMRVLGHLSAVRRMNTAWRLLLLCPMVLTMLGCDSQEKQARREEARRVECLDKICEGDKTPPYNRSTERIFKKYGQWYVAPSSHFNYEGILGFDWWDHRPLDRTQQRPPEVQKLAVEGKGYDISIEVFLTGRHRWPEPNAVEPWKRESSYEVRWRELQAKGFRLERSRPKPDLEVVRVFDDKGQPTDGIYYIAVNEREYGLSNRASSMRCELPRPSGSESCAGGSFFNANVFADYRFRAKHANDWPAISKEINRVLSLVKEVKP